jgi:hypothetical protein
MTTDQGVIVLTHQVVEGLARIHAVTGGGAQRCVDELDPCVFQVGQEGDVVDVSIGIHVAEADLDRELEDVVHDSIFSKPMVQSTPE